jgi:preprotein translocase subunit SecE
MNARAEAGSSGLDTAKLVVRWLLSSSASGLLFFAATHCCCASWFCSCLPGGAAALALTSAPGRQLWRFAVDARMEVRKVVWPTRQETMQTTLIVIVMVFDPRHRAVAVRYGADGDPAVPDRAGG